MHLWLRYWRPHQRIWSDGIYRVICALISFLHVHNINNWLISKCELLQNNDPDAAKILYRCSRKFTRRLFWLDYLQIQLDRGVSNGIHEQKNVRDSYGGMWYSRRSCPLRYNISGEFYRVCSSKSVSSLVIRYRFILK